MKTAYLLIASLFAASTTLAGCGVDRADVTNEDVQGYYFSGYVYDGVSAAPLKDYKLTLTYDGVVVPGEGAGGAADGATSLEATVDANGRYHVGPLKPQSDFSISIEAEGYRTFNSHNEQRFGLPGGVERQSTEIYEAYLFPSGLESPGVTLELFSENDAQPRPTGKVRISPFNGDGESELSLAGTIGASVNGQLWQNDDDARSATVIKDVEDGVLEIGAGDLVYGVTYTATVYSVDGHQYDNFIFTAGITGSQSVVLPELEDSALQLVSSSLDGGEPNEDGTLRLVFNRPIRIAPSQSEAYVLETIDDNFSIFSPDEDADLNVNALATTTTDDDSTQENGTGFEIDGNTITLSWANVAGNFETRDTDDPILSVTYGGFANIQIQAVGDQAIYDLWDFTGNTLTVDLVPLAP
ncbi:MAG TPA: hypothetical protein VLC09_08880 [Polyangiaceae bacterium]|nr:hypothetical protein [Polyangiaceae bacterium]